MEKEKTEKLRQFMQDEYSRFIPMFQAYQWPWETARWHELVFCVLVSINRSSAGITIARETTGILVNLDLLDIDALTQLISESGEPDLTKPEFALMMGILKRQGYNDVEAEAAVVTIFEAARSLQKGFDGKVQKYLRKYGEEMLNDVPNNFSFSRISDMTVKHVFTNWLQNVLTMPVAFSNPNTNAVCEEFGIEIKELVDVADSNDINVALVDDWASDYLRRERSEVAL